MSRKRIGMLTVVSLGLLAGMLCSPMLWAESPARQVILEADSWWDFVEEHELTNPAIIWIDGERYEGELFYSGEGKMNRNGWHGTEYRDYYFPDLGWLYLSGTAKTSFAYVTPEHRWHPYSSHVKIIGGTGAFAEAHGVFHLVGYTNWLLPPYHWPLEAFAFAGGKGMLVGMQVD